MTEKWSERQVYWATLGYVRWWLTTDGPMLRRLERLGGFTAPVLREVAVAYNVNRGISKIKNGRDSAAEGLIELLKSAKDRWPTSLTERASACVSVAGQACRYECTSKQQASAISKFMWFMAPDDWTIFDRFAANGADVSTALTGADRMTAFYARLERLSFVATAQAMQSVIQRSTMPKLPATRILDSLLMARGGRGSSIAEISATRDFIDLLPPVCQAELTALASLLQGKFGNEVLTKKSETVRYGA